MKKYVLISCTVRDLNMPSFFDTFEEAYEHMMKEFKEILGYSEDYIFTDSDIKELEENDMGFNEYSAWCESDYGDNYDWHIYEVEF